MHRSLLSIEHSASDSDKENATATFSRKDAIAKADISDITSKRFNLASVLRELPVSGASERKSLRDRKGDRGGRIVPENESARASSRRVNPTPSRNDAANEVGVEQTQLIADGEERVSEEPENASAEVKQASMRKGVETSPHTSVRLQAAIAENAISSSVSPKTSDSPREDPQEATQSSFDPDSPLPTSRAPRHSLLLALTTSPLKFDETSLTKSPSDSPSPARRDLLFAPEFHNVTTPSRVRQKPMTVAAAETPSGQATSRHRLARTLRQEQSMIERQATINDKLSAISLSMSGIKASSYGASSMGLPKEITGERQHSAIHRSVTKQRSPIAPTVHVKRTLSVTSSSVFEDGEKNDGTTSTNVEPTRKSSSKAGGASQGENGSHSSAIELTQSRIPKSVAPPSQPVFRKPTVSGLPTLKPSTLPSKSLSSSTSSTTSKSAATITMSYKATRPDAGHQQELPRYATPVKGRLPSASAFRSPAASRVISASNPAKPIQSRNVSGNMTNSVPGAMRPMTPGKLLSRSTIIEEGAKFAPHREMGPKDIFPHSNTVSERPSSDYRVS